MICAVCHRQARGFGYDPLLTFGVIGELAHACSMAHLDIISKEFGMIDPTPHEIMAAIEGGRAGGEYLESIGKTDLATLTREEWQQFLLCVLGQYTRTLAKEVTAAS